MELHALCHTQIGAHLEHRASGNYEKQLQHPPDGTGTSTWRTTLLPNFNVHIIRTYIYYMLPHEYNCTYDYALHGVLKWQPLKQVALSLQQEKIQTTNVIRES